MTGLVDCGDRLSLAVARRPGYGNGNVGIAREGGSVRADTASPPTNAKGWRVVERSAQM